VTARKALITGGAGFIGSHVAERFIESGWSVEIVDNLSSGRRENVPRAARLVELDIGSEQARALVRGGDFDAICHLAAQIDVRKSVVDPGYDARTNVVGTLNLIQGVVESGRRTRFIFSSTGGALYGDFTPPPSGEEAPKEPDAPYGVSKLSAEYYLAAFARLYGLDLVALRYANVYGPRQDPHGEAGVVAIFCGRILDGRPLTAFGDGRQTRDYVFVEDVARANLAAASAELPPVAGVDGRAFNIGTSRETSVLELAEAIARAAGERLVIEHAPARPGELQRSAVRIDKATRWLGWRPQVSLDDGLSRTFRWFADRRSATPT
jgi:UDP-glucose 4-epimerase